MHCASKYSRIYNLLLPIARFRSRDAGRSNQDRRHEYQMLRLNMHVPWQSIRGANLVDHLPKVLAMMVRQVCPLSKVRSHAHRAYFYHQHRQLVINHLTSAWRELDKNLIYELPDKHRHYLVHKLRLFQSRFASIGSFG